MRGRSPTELALPTSCTDFAATQHSHSGHRLQPDAQHYQIQPWYQTSVLLSHTHHDPSLENCKAELQAHNCLNNTSHQQLRLTTSSKEHLIRTPSAQKLWRTYYYHGCSSALVINVRSTTKYTTRVTTNKYQICELLMYHG